MATVTGYTAAHTQAIVDSTVVDAEINVSGDLIFTRHDGSTFDAGSALPALPAATTTVSGIVELATSAEATAGTDAVRAITPATAKAIIDALVINGLADVTITSPTTNDVLQWNGTQWVNRNFVTVTGDVTAAKGRFGGSTGDAVFIGDDGKLTDINTANMIGVQGQQDAAQGGFVFGSANDTKLYRSGGQRLKTDGEFETGLDLYARGISVGNGSKLSVSGLTRAATSGTTSPSAESALGTGWSNGTNSMTFKNGYLYLCLVWYQLSDNINSSYSITIPRLYTSGGLNLNGWVHYNGFNGHLGLTYSQWFYIKRVAGSDLTTGIGMTVQRYFSGVAGTSNIDNAVIDISDAGRVSDHPSASGIAAAI